MKIIKIINPEGFSSAIDYAMSKKYGRDVYHIVVSKKSPLTLQDSKGFLWRINWDSYTDGCSVPSFIDGLPYFERTRFMISGTVHDDGYRNEGLWNSADGTVWHFVKLHRKELDELLFYTIPLEGELKGIPRQAKIVAPVYWTAVHFFGGSRYGRAKIKGGTI